VARAATDQTLDGHIIEVGGPENLTLNEIASRVAGGAPPRHIPPIALKAMALLAARTPRPGSARPDRTPHGPGGLNLRLRCKQGGAPVARPDECHRRYHGTCCGVGTPPARPSSARATGPQNLRWRALSAPSWRPPLPRAGYVSVDPPGSALTSSPGNAGVTRPRRPRH
jgi:hypothetical protein